MYISFRLIYYRITINNNNFIDIAPFKNLKKKSFQSALTDKTKAVQYKAKTHNTESSNKGDINKMKVEEDEIQEGDDEN